ncbi:MipA/OmpV family protein [uncultured Massilia sp.]|uniref:MipA/OmpV family protein n=1 Tax=uncultured Massilia sp. TaxID=169973 RepID=UPI0025CEEC58|nr:MipA/OmpV family protein [uncultured Massilia sp.]
MNKFLFLALTAGCGVAWAQTPATNPMPDGSRDMYVGLGVQSAPRYDGAASRKVSALPVLQVQWSNGVFISGMSAGMHLSDDPVFEYGPLLAVHPGRDESGAGSTIGGIGVVEMTGFIPSPIDKTFLKGERLGGMEEIGARLQAGAFANYYLDPRWRLTGSLLAGAGKERDGVRLELGVQRLAVLAQAHHRVSLSAGVAVVNRRYNDSYFGVSTMESMRSRFPYYSARGGLQDAHVGAHWNWTLSPSWMLTSNVQATRLLGSARNSPLVERPTNVTVSTAIAYRF